MRFVVYFLALLACASTLAADQPRLIVIVSVDQLRPDRLGPQLPGGLGRLVREGSVFSNATLDHALTNTCPGHVVMSTGVNPSKAGIPGNSYVDHETMEDRYCVDDPDPETQVFGSTEQRSPRSIAVTTLGDWLKTSQPESKVVSISGKDRAAITLGGHNADAVYWYDHDTGIFTTSAYYAKTLPDILSQFNAGSFFTSGFGQRFPETWEHPVSASRPDDFSGESEMNSRTSGHPLNVGDNRAEQFYFSPFVDVATAELARRVIDQEKLGQRGVTDYLALSFSATDVVGHLYGPYSSESEDTLRILDEQLGDLLTLLDETLDGEYVLALSADHGVLPLPELLVERGEMSCPGQESGRINIQRFGFFMLWHLYKESTFPFGNPLELAGFSSAGITVNKEFAEELGVSVDEVTNLIVSYLHEQPEIAKAWTEQTIMETETEMARLFRNSFVPGKSAHVIPQFHETCLMFRPEGTSHGSPYLYDRAVPLIFFGQNIKKQTSAVSSHSIDIAPTIAAKLGIEAPKNLDGRVLDVWETK